MGFYKKDGENLVCAPDAVHTPTVTLKSIDKDIYAYPVEGWYWFDALDEVITYFSLENRPKAITMRQRRLALLQAGLLSVVSAAIESLPSPQKEAAQIEWEYSQEVQRHHRLVPLMGAALGLSEEQIDQLFILGATL